MEFSARSSGYGGRSPRHALDEEESADIFRVEKTSKYEGAPPEMKKPLVLGGYSVDGDRKIIYDRSQLQFLDKAFLSEEPMDVQLDLTRGLEEAIDYKGESQESFENLLRWVLRNQHSLVSETSSQRLSLDILCMRGTLKQICRSPYTPRDSWAIHVAEFQGSFYIVPAPSEPKADPRPTGRKPKRELWGNKFEQYLKGDPDDILDPNKEYRSVLKLSVGQFSLLFSPEVDCADPDLYREDHKDMGAFVLVKALRDETKMNFQFYKQSRLSDWWLDNKLVGIPRIIVGHFTQGGIVHSIELLKTEELPALGENEWDPNVYINFLVRFLKFMKQKVMEDTAAVYKFERRPMGHIYCSKLKKSDSVFLPLWYTQKLFTKEKTGEENTEAT
nr:decapping and exoribonuclease protein-like isoform X3 [Penaeus vannamei]